MTTKIEEFKGGGSTVLDLKYRIRAIMKQRPGGDDALHNAVHERTRQLLTRKPRKRAK